MFSADSVTPSPKKAGTSMIAAIPPESSAYQPKVRALVKNFFTVSPLALIHWTSR